MSKPNLFYLQAIAAVLVIAVGITWMVFQWNECRDMGFSFWYCVQHIG